MKGTKGAAWLAPLWMLIGIALFVAILGGVYYGIAANDENIFITKTTHAESYMLQNNGSIQLFPNAPQTCNATTNNGSLYYDGDTFYSCAGAGWTVLGGTAAGEPLWNDNSSTVARTGDCGAGEFVQNTTTGGVECASGSIAESDPDYHTNPLGYLNTSTGDNATWNQSHADTLYEAIGTYSANALSYYNITTLAENDPLWSDNFTGYNKTAWDTAYGWGDHSGEGYLTAEADSDYHTNPLSYYNTTTIPSYLESESDPLWSDNSSTVARTGTCTAGNFVQNTTSSGVQCAAPSGSGDITAVTTAADSGLQGGADNGDVDLSVNSTHIDLTFATDAALTSGLAAQDACSEITDCVVGAITEEALWQGNSTVVYYRDNPLGFYNSTTIPDYEEESHCTEHDGNYLSCDGEELDVDLSSVVATAGDTMTGNLTMGDNVNITLGGSAIWNNGSGICIGSC